MGFIKMKKTSSSYQLLPKKTEESRENEIRVKAQTRPFVYAAYAGKLLLENKQKNVFMLATGSATSKAIQSVEYIRRRVANLQVCYEIESTEFIDEYEPLVEGLDHVQVRRLVPTLKAHLFLGKNQELEAKPGYMPALPANEIFDQERFKADIEDHFMKDRTSGPYKGERNGPRRGYNNRDRFDRPQSERGQYRASGPGESQGQFRREQDGRPVLHKENRGDGEPRGYRGDGQNRRRNYEDRGNNNRPQTAYEGERRGRGGYDGQRRNRGGSAYDGERRERDNYRPNEQGDRPSRGGQQRQERGARGGNSFRGQ